MITIERVPWEDARAAHLRDVMEEDMQARYGGAERDEPAERTAERERVLSVDPAAVVSSVLALDEDGSAVGHIAAKRRGDGIELKRLIVLDAARGRGVATRLLAECEAIGREAGVARLVLQTGDRQPEAVALYEKTGWSRIPILPEYAASMPFSICFAKDL